MSGSVHPGGHAKTSGRAILLIERQTQALELRKSGAQLREIAKHFGVSHQLVYKWIQKALIPLRQELTAAAEELRAMEVAKIDRLLRAAWPKAIGKQKADGTYEVQPDLDAIDTVHGLIKTKCNLLGLNIKPEKSPDDEPPLPQGLTLNVKSEIVHYHLPSNGRRVIEG